jgi:TRAP-type C4-dicarboxylate transport system permease large subunit
MLLCGALMIVTAVISRRPGYQPSRPRFVSRAELWSAFANAIWVLTIPLFILIGIRYGIFTPTEAGAMTVPYAALIGFANYRELKLSDLPSVLTETVLATSTVMPIICSASAFGFYMKWERIPFTVASTLVELAQDRYLLLLLINLMLISFFPQLVLFLPNALME